MSAGLWNSRYQVSEYVYGEEPNEFFKSELLKLPAGSLLLPGEGEGRNAVFAAKQGWKVSAFDWSEEAKKKAETLARKENVQLEYTIGSFEHFTVPEFGYDAVGLIFIHQPEELRIEFHKRVISSLKPGGHVIFYAYEKSQIKNLTGGPKETTLLYSLEDVISDFIDMDFLELSHESVTLNEGKLHIGDSEIIKFVGRKKVE